jgi:hypothetical protein
MAKGKGLSTTAKVLIASAVVIGAGVGLYLILKKKKKGEEKDEEQLVVSESGGGKTVEEKKSGCKTPNLGCKVVRPAELKTEEDVKKFQRFLDANHPLWYQDASDCKYKNLCEKSADGRLASKGCGSYGCQTQGAWNKWGTSYISSVNLVATYYKSPLNIPTETGKFTYGATYVPPTTFNFSPTKYGSLYFEGEIDKLDI